ncbi:MAG TPA: polysaccharide deacetylase family protein, partial [Clostridiaceae bacterium]|nr:polysaccharide deacetylase family protein [Clostridiaceae bacterium]
FVFTFAFSSPIVWAISSQLITKGSTSSKVVALTFDDGDDGANIQGILAILAANNIKSTFFITGKAAEDHPSLIRAITAAGHEIGNHSYSHPDFTTISYSTMQSQLSTTENIISGITGRSTKPYFRPPFGAYNSSVLQAVGDAGYTRTIYWTIDTIDWDGRSTYAIYSKVFSNVTPGAIVLMHTGSGAPNTKHALQQMINGLRDMGYGFGTVSDILGGTSSGGSSTTSPVLRVGSTGSAVSQLQQALVNKGYSLSVDGAFGPMTKNAVVSFQRNVGITADGIVGPVTWSKLGTSSGSYTGGTSGGTSTSYPGLLRVGSTGTGVKTLQQALVNKGYSLSADGAFGPITQNAVRSFQSSQGITADGIVGHVTWGKLF